MDYQQKTGALPEAQGIGDGDVLHANAISQLYSPIWHDALDAFVHAIQPHMLEIVEEGYAQCSYLQAMQRFFAMLPETEKNERKAAHADMLMGLASPHLDEQHHRTMALEVGKTRAIEGIAYNELMQINAAIMAKVPRHINPVAHKDAMAIFSQRKYRSFAWYAEAYTQVDAQFSTALLEITRLVWRVETYTDFINQIALMLSERIPILGCSIGRSDGDDVFRYEVVAGCGMNDFLLDMEKSLQPVIGEGAHGPSARAWLSGRIEHCIHFDTDKRMEPWKGAAQRAGCRSCAAILLSNQPRTVLSLYSRVAGGFFGSGQIAFLEQLQTILTLALNRINANNLLLNNSRAIPYAMRQHWVALLRTDALEMHYQPLLHMKSNRVTKVEALARLRDGKHLLSPEQFLPALSSDDFVVLYSCGLNQALRHIKYLNEQGHEISVSINLPSSALGDGRYFEVTQRALATCGFAPHMLMLEILETEEIRQDIDAIAELQRYKKLGITLAEDDIGTGYSNLTRLRELPFDCIKIDRGLSALTGQDALTALRFIHQLTRLGHSFGKNVVVEGVEEKEMLVAMKMLSVDMAQGYAIAKPMSGENLGAWLSTSHLDAPHDPTLQSSLVNLVQLVIWEERLSLALNGAELQRLSGAPGSEAPLFSLQLHADLASTCPAVMAHLDTATKLMQLALQNGTNSTEYVSERTHLAHALANAA